MRTQRIQDSENMLHRAPRIEEKSLDRPEFIGYYFIAWWSHKFPKARRPSLSGNAKFVIPAPPDTIRLQEPLTP